MVVYHPGSLHERIQDRTATELKTSGNHVFAHGIGNRAGGWNLGDGLPAILDGRPSGEPPKIGIQRTEFLLYLEDTVGVIDDGTNFGFVAHDPGIGEQFLDFQIVVLGNQVNIKIIESLSKILPFTQDHIPTQTCLHPVQRQKFKQNPVIVQRFSPLFVMITGKENIIEIPFTTGD